MWNHLKKTTALWWAKKHVANAGEYKSRAIEDQKKELKSLLDESKNTDFGKKHHFSSIETIKDFQENVPVSDYEDIKDYIEDIKKGKQDVLWKGKPQYFAKTSGTTSGSKYIPISKEGISYQISAAQSAILHYIEKKNDAHFVSGKMIFLQGNPALEDLNEIKVGRLSGIVAHHIPSYLQKNRLPSWETNGIEDWETKINAIVQETEHQDMTLISGIPPWIIMYFEKLIERNQKKITTLFPNLQLIITGGVNYEPYQKKMDELLGKTVDVIQTYPASEGFFAFQDDYQKEGLLLLTNHGIFYEFIPLGQLGKNDAKRLTLEEIELDRDYALVISTNSGLWAYMIGDVVRFIEKNPYRILVTGRTKHFTSAFGEHVIAYEVEESLKATLHKHPAQITEFHLAPQVNPSEGLPHHEWFIEFEKEPENLKIFRDCLESEMRNRNTYYNDLITGNVLQELKITRLKKNAFQEYAKSQGKLGGQNKIPRLANDRTIAEILEKYSI